MAYLRFTLFDVCKELITYVQISHLHKYSRRDMHLSSSEIRMLVGLPTTILLSLLCSLLRVFFFVPCYKHETHIKPYGQVTCDIL